MLPLKMSSLSVHGLGAVLSSGVREKVAEDTVAGCFREKEAAVPKNRFAGGSPTVIGSSQFSRGGSPEDTELKDKKEPTLVDMVTENPPNPVSNAHAIPLTHDPAFSAVSSKQNPNPPTSVTHTSNLTPYDTYTPNLTPHDTHTSNLTPHDTSSTTEPANSSKSHATVKPKRKPSWKKLARSQQPIPLTTNDPLFP
ncbi:hypothetical protein FCV25MIE_30830 [Fagus crenata]